MKRWLISALCLVIAAGTQAADQPGLKLTLAPAGQGVADARVSRMPALVVPGGTTVSPFLEPGPFTARWSGVLKLPLRNRYRFHFAGVGRLWLSLDGEVVFDGGNDKVSDWVRLKGGENAFEALYESPEKGDAVMRLLWSSADHPPESIPPTLWFHDDADEELQHGLAMRRGREVFAERQCLRCHAGGDEAGGTLAMPEMAKGAPLLLDCGLRLKRDWLARWVADPPACREQVSMPRMFTGPGAKQQSRDVAAYLETLKFGALADASPVPEDEETVAAGGRLYAQLGCVGCHSLEEKARPGTLLPRISLRHVKDKYLGPALREYLQKPKRAYLSNRMPDFELSAEEANGLAAFLLAQGDEPPPPAEAGDAERGKKLVETSGCMNCHPLPVASRYQPPSLADVRKGPMANGCLSPEPGKAPDLGLSARAIADLKMFLASGLPSLSRGNSLEFAERQHVSQQCSACHERDGEMDAWTRFQGEVARWAPKKKTDHEGQPEPAQERPPLTWAGEKLVPDWTRSLLAGELEEPARPWLHARMPAYPLNAPLLAMGLAHGHGIAEWKEKEEQADPALVEIGRSLVTKQLGFGCTDCHGIGEQPAVAVFEAEGVNFAQCRDRLLPEYYHRLLRDPTRIDPKTTMPRYGDAHGYTPITDVLDGDARQQFEAIRHYLLAGPGIKPPPRPEREKRRDVNIAARVGGDPGDERGPDWVDDRWQQMDNGPAVFHTYKFPRGRAARGIAIRLGAPFSAAMIFDQERLAWRAAWTGDFLKFSDQRWGLLHSPKIAGDLQFSMPDLLGWEFDGSFDDRRVRKIGPMPAGFGRYEGLHLHGQRAFVSYRVGEVPVLDAPGVMNRDGFAVFTRDLQIDPATRKLRAFLLEGGKRGVELREVGGVPLGVITEKDKVTAVALSGAGELALHEGRRLVMDVPPRAKAARVRLFYFAGSETKLPEFVAAVKSAGGVGNLGVLTTGGPLRWGEPLVTEGHISERDDPLVIDTVTMPYENPWNALMFAGGHDSLSDGRAAVCTLHGDVWLVDGIDDDLDRITWQRFATGLYQPLGLRIIDDRIHVGCRDQIVILEDRNGDGEADFYRNFSSLVQVNGGGHSFHTCLQTDPEGSFYFLKCANGGSQHGGSLLKVSADGKELEVVATGFRNPNGLGVSPTGLITEADQQGTWVPETRIDIIEKGGFYGFMPMHHREVEPKSYDGPLCWIPRPLDNSAGGQVWVQNKDWGPLDGQLLHISWGRCTLMMILTDKVDGTWQGGVVPIPGQFLSGIHRGRHSPKDGHLYLTGCDGWQTAAVRDGCFQRLRRTGKPFHLPVGLEVHENGIRVTFSQPLDPGTAEDPSAYAVERWNYRWTRSYGSKDWSVADPEKQGRDPVKVTKAELSEDGRSVFIHMEDLKPVMQMRLEYNLDAADGTLVRGELPFTIHKMR